MCDSLAQFLQEEFLHGTPGPHHYRLVSLADADRVRILETCAMLIHTPELSKGSEFCRLGLNSPSPATAASLTAP